MSIISRISLPTLLMLSLNSAYANSATACLIDWIAPPQPLPDAQQRLTQIDADRLSQSDSDHLLVEGNIYLKQPGLVILADQLLYHRPSQRLQSFGEIQLHHRDAILIGAQGELDQQQQTARIHQARYQLIPSRAHGRAEQIQLNQNTRISDLENASFTTCALTNPDWQLHADHLEINENTRRVYGKHTWLKVKDWPIFYTPYFDFPLDERASGFLFPAFGSYNAAAQDHNQTYLHIPYYFNIAPHLDDTLSLTLIEQRGLLIDNEFRYLQPHHQGELQLSWLQDQLSQSQGRRYLTPEGDIRQDSKVRDRWRASFQGQQRWSDTLHSSLNWHEVSDIDVYNDLPRTPNQRYQHDNSLLRQALINYQQGPWRAHIQHYGYLRLRNGAINYEKSPEIGVNYHQRFGDLDFNLYTELSEFTLPSGYRTRPTGQRRLIQPRLSYELRRPYGFMHAQVQANHRHYQLSQAPRPGDEQPSSTVMQYALRGGLYFEREFNLRSHRLSQTLEPELQYLNVPYINQSALPVFDSALASIDFSNLFQLNRYSGADRIGDTQQISAALTSRIQNEEGETLFEAGAGQIFYLADRRVDLNLNRHGAAQTQARSDYFIKLATRFNGFEFASSSQFREKDWRLTQSQNRLKINLHQRLTLLGVYQGYDLHQSATRQETLATGMMFQLSDHWELANYLQYDLAKNRQSELAGGLRYESCCWASELILQRTQAADGRYNHGIRYVIEFKGLSSVGNRLSDSIQQNLNF
ncbi:MAG: LPS assembly protein LptD [Thiomicrospira sp.]